MTYCRSHVRQNVGTTSDASHLLANVATDSGLTVTGWPGLERGTSETPWQLWMTHVWSYDLSEPARSGVSFAALSPTPATLPRGLDQGDKLVPTTKPCRLHDVATA